MRLRAKGFRITAVGSAEQALAQIAVDPPRVVVSDVRLPGLDGLALFEEIRRTRPTLPVILLTAHGNIPDAVAATSRGVFGYLTKPFDSQILLEKIDRALLLSASSPGTGNEQLTELSVTKPGSPGWCSQ
jgi:two-component system response regulator GlrR